MSELLLIADPGADRKRAESLSEKLHIPLGEEKEAQSEDCLFLRLSESGLSLNGKGMEMRGDFHQMLPRLKKSRLNGEMLVKAARLKGLDCTPVVLDATAGMGEDSLLLAAVGHEVYLFEKDPVIAALLEDALIRGAEIPELKEIVARMHLTGGDSMEAMRSGTIKADVIYLDPMFPARSKSGLIKKKFQLLQQLEQPCNDEEALLDAALQAEPKRIVIKRPAKGPYLAGKKPSYTIAGKAIRYDCIVP